MIKYTVCVTGKDSRQDYLAQYLTGKGIHVIRHEDFSPESIRGADMLIGPVTFYKAGKLLPEIEEACRKENIPVLNYMASEDFMLRNAYLTAEGFLSLLIQNTPFSLDESNILLLGLGCCGKAIEKLLRVLPCRLDAFDQVPVESIVQRAYNVVVNTIPAPVIRREQLSQLPDGCRLFDIASLPGGYDEDAVQELGFILRKCPGIPGQMSPQSAGFCIGQCAMQYMYEKKVTIHS